MTVFFPLFGKKVPKKRKNGHFRAHSSWWKSGVKMEQKWSKSSGKVE